MKKARCKKRADSIQIPWKDLQETHFHNRSIDDLRNAWAMKILPILRQDHQTWTDEEDLQLLKAIYQQKVEDEEDIDFDIENDQTEADNELRWKVLLKNESVFPGKKVNVHMLAKELYREIKVNKNIFAQPAVPVVPVAKKTGRNQFFDIVAHYQKHYSEK